MKVAPPPDDPHGAEKASLSQNFIPRSLEIAVMTICLMLAGLQFLFVGFWSFAVVAVVRGVCVPFLCLVLLFVLGGNVRYVAMQKQRQQQLTRFRKAALACYFTCLVCTFVPLLQSLSVINALPGAFSFGRWLFLSLHRLNLSGTAHGDYEPETYTYRSHRSLEDRDPEMRWSEGCPSSSRPFDPDLKLDVWRPEDPNGQAILYIHGGGWSLLDKSNSFHIRHMLESGYTVVSPQYSLVCHGYNGEDMLDDLVAARRYLSTRAEQWGVDDERVTVVGTSSGGHLALLLAYTHPSNFTNVYNLYGPGAFAEWFEKGWTAGGTAGLEFACHNVEDWWR